MVCRLPLPCIHLCLFLECVLLLYLLEPSHNLQVCKSQVLFLSFVLFIPKDEGLLITGYKDEQLDNMQRNFCLVNLELEHDVCEFNKIDYYQKFKQFVE